MNVNRELTFKKIIKKAHISWIKCFNRNDSVKKNNKISRLKEKIFKLWRKDNFKVLNVEQEKKSLLVFAANLTKIKDEMKNAKKEKKQN